MKHIALFICTLLLLVGPCGRSYAQSSSGPTSGFTQLDPQNSPWSWTYFSTTGFTQRGIAASAVVNGKIYVMGGDFFPRSDSDYAVNILEMYDPVTNTWSTPITKGTFTPRFGLCAETVDDKIYAIGGGTSFRTDDVFVGIEVFDPITNSWSIPQTTGKFTPRAFAASCVLNGKIYVIGGGFPGYTILDPSFDIFDPATNAWTSPVTTGHFTQRYSLAVSAVGGKIYTLGGATADLNMTNTLEVLDPSTNTWSTPQTTGVFTPRSGLCSGVIEGNIYAFGGYGSDDVVKTLEVYNPTTNVWTNPVTSGNPSPQGNAPCSIVDDKMYTLGGFGYKSYLGLNQCFSRFADDGIPKAAANPTQVTPNPTKGIVTVEGVDANAARITIANVLGETVLDIPTNHSSTVTLDLTKLPSGTYFARFLSQEGAVVKKIIRE